MSSLSLSRMALVLRYGGRDFEVHFPKAQVASKIHLRVESKYKYQRRITSTASGIFEHFWEGVGYKFTSGFS
jgi:hypothetical protein